MRVHETDLSIDALGGHTLLGDTVACALDPRSLHPAAAQGKLLQPLGVSCIAPVWKAEGQSQSHSCVFSSIYKPLSKASNFLLLLHSNVRTGT